MAPRILIVDAHPTVRESLRFVFAAAGMEHLEEAISCQGAVDAMHKGRIDVVLLDVALHEANGLDVLRDIKAIDPAAAILVHSYHENPQLLTRSFHAGAVGYLVKGEDKNLLIRAVQQAAAGGNVWTAEQMDRIRQADTDIGSRARRGVASSTTSTDHTPAALFADD